MSIGLRLSNEGDNVVAGKLRNWTKAHLKSETPKFLIGRYGRGVVNLDGASPRPFNLRFRVFGFAMGFCPISDCPFNVVSRQTPPPKPRPRRPGTKARQER